MPEIPVSDPRNMHHGRWLEECRERAQQGLPPSDVCFYPRTEADDIDDLEGDGEGEGGNDQLRRETRKRKLVDKWGVLGYVLFWLRGNR